MASGNLLRFDARTLALAAEAVPHTRAMALAALPDGTVFVGLADGQVRRLDPVLLASILSSSCPRTSSGSAPPPIARAGRVWSPSRGAG